MIILDNSYNHQSRTLWDFYIKQCTDNYKVAALSQKNVNKCCFTVRGFLKLVPLFLSDMLVIGAKWNLWSLIRQKGMKYVPSLSKLSESVFGSSDTIAPNLSWHEIIVLILSHECPGIVWKKTWLYLWGFGKELNTIYNWWHIIHRENQFKEMKNISFNVNCII